MANEVTLNASLDYSDSESMTEGLSIVAAVLSVTNKRVVRIKQSVTTVEAALNLGTVTSLGYIMVINRDATNYVELRVATGGTKNIKVRAGKCALFEFGSGVTAPYIIANTAACQVEYLLISS